MRIEEPSQELGPRAFRIVSPGHLIERLVTEAERFPGFVLHRGLTSRELLRDTEGRVRGTRASGPGGEIVLNADLVIGADGRASTVRKRAGLTLDLTPESYDVLWLKAEPSPEQRSTLQLCASGAEAALGYRSWDGRWQIGWLIDKGGWREARAGDWLGRVAALLPDPLARHLLGQRERLPPPVLLDVEVGRAPSWHSPGVLLLGDAAHPMSPVRAQGINMALRDAIVAGNHLVHAASRGAPIDAACRAIQRERDAEIVPIQKLQYRELAGQRWARQQPWLVRPLLAVSSRLARASWFGPLWLRQQRPFRFGVCDVRLKV